MSAPGLERCLTFINCHLQPPDGSRGYFDKEAHPRSVTISRQSGSGAHPVAEKLAAYLQQRKPGEVCPWTVFDRELVQKAIEEHHLPAQLAKFMPEDKISEVQDALDYLLGLHPASFVLVQKLAQTVLHLVELGNVIIIGRGANIVTSRLDYVFNVRLVASEEKRLECLQRTQKLDRKAALDLLRTEDRGRRRFVKKYFGKDVDDPLLYHLQINTDLVSYDTAARLIGDAVVTGWKEKALERQRVAA